MRPPRACSRCWRPSTDAKRTTRSSPNIRRCCGARRTSSRKARGRRASSRAIRSCSTSSRAARELHRDRLEGRARDPRGRMRGARRRRRAPARPSAPLQAAPGVALHHRRPRGRAPRDGAFRRALRARRRDPRRGARRGGEEPGIVPRPGTLAVIGYGKLGGKELGYGSDLDIIFLYDEALAPGRREARARRAAREHLAHQPHRGGRALRDRPAAAPRRRVGAAGELARRLPRLPAEARVDLGAPGAHARAFVAGDAALGAASRRCATRSSPRRAIARALRGNRRDAPQDARRAQARGEGAESISRAASSTWNSRCRRWCSPRGRSIRSCARTRATTRCSSARERSASSTEDRRRGRRGLPRDAPAHARSRVERRGPGERRAGRAGKREGKR